MSSRCAYDGLSERYKHVEMPLPTYEEVVAGASASNPSIGFKPDVLLGPATASTSRQNAERRNVDDNETHYVPAPKTSNRTVIILSLIGSIVIPMCAMIIILQVKVCTAPSRDQQPEPFTSKAESEKLRQDYQNLYNEKKVNEFRVRNLQMQITELITEKEKLKQKLENSTKHPSPSRTVISTTLPPTTSSRPSPQKSQEEQGLTDEALEDRLQQLTHKLMYGQINFKGLQRDLDNLLASRNISYT